MTYRHVKAGERFVVQDAVEDTAYIIQRGFYHRAGSGPLDSRRPTAYRIIGKYVATDIIGRGQRPYCGICLRCQRTHDDLSLKGAKFKKLDLKDQNLNSFVEICRICG